MDDRNLRLETLDFDVSSNLMDNKYRNRFILRKLKTVGFKENHALNSISRIWRWFGRKGYPQSIWSETVSESINSNISCSSLLPPHPPAAAVLALSAGLSLWKSFRDYPCPSSFCGGYRFWILINFNIQQLCRCLVLFVYGELWVHQVQKTTNSMFLKSSICYLAHQSLTILIEDLLNLLPREITERILLTKNDWNRMYDAPSK